MEKTNFYSSLLSGKKKFFFAFSLFFFFCSMSPIFAMRRTDRERVAELENSATLQVNLRDLNGVRPIRIKGSNTKHTNYSILEQAVDQKGSDLQITFGDYVKRLESWDSWLLEDFKRLLDDPQDPREIVIHNHIKDFFVLEQEAFIDVMLTDMGTIAEEEPDPGIRENKKEKLQELQKFRRSKEVKREIKKIKKEGTEVYREGNYGPEESFSFVHPKRYKHLRKLLAASRNPEDKGVAQGIESLKAKKVPVGHHFHKITNLERGEAFIKSLRNANIAILASNQEKLEEVRKAFFEKVPVQAIARILGLPLDMCQREYDQLQQLNPFPSQSSSSSQNTHFGNFNNLY